MLLEDLEAGHAGHADVQEGHVVEVARELARGDPEIGELAGIGSGRHHRPGGCVGADGAALGGGLGDPLFRAVAGFGVGVVANGPTGRHAQALHVHCKHINGLVNAMQ